MEHHLTAGDHEQIHKQSYIKDRLLHSLSREKAESDKVGDKASKIII